MDERKLEKRRKSESDENYLLDRISVLPYEILVSIVSLLSVKEAGSTSILSRRWKNVWKYTMTLNFQDIDFSVGDSFRSFKAQDQEHQEQSSCNYVNWVDRVLEQHRGQNAERFRAFFFINSSFTSSIDKWIEFALEKRVEVLELQFLPSEDGYTEDNYTFPPRLLDLSSNIPSLHSCRFSVGFKYLKHLLFQHVGVIGEVLEYFLSNFPVLERLEVFIAKNLVSLRVIGISTSLKYLEIKNCPDIRSIEISNANIVSFVYEGHWVDLLLSNVPLLVEVDIFKPDLDIYNFTTLVFNQLSCCLSQLEILKLSIWGVIPYLLSCAIPALENMKHLELSVQADDMWDLDLITSFMKACPYIQKLVINMGFVKYDEYYDMKVAGSRHYSIKVVEIVGYRGCTCALQHVMYVMKNAVALEKLIIDPVRRPHSGMDRGAQSVEEEAYAREHRNLLNSCRYSVGFKSIKLLHLRHVGVTGKVLQYFLSNCPALERLTVMFAKNLVSLRVAGPSISLKYLVIKYCPEIKSIEICNSNILSFVYKGDWIDLLLSNVPLLVEVDIFKRNLDSADFIALAFNRISCCLSQLETLKLSIWGVDHSLNYAAPVLENLKYLELYVKTDYDWDLNHLTSFMKACPSIQKLVLTMNVSLENEHNAENVAECPHHSIKEVEIVGYRGCACALQHVEYLVENAIALEKLIIDPVQRWIWPSGMNRGAVSVEEEAKAREHVKKHLKDRVPSNIEFVCL